MQTFMIWLPDDADAEDAQGAATEAIGFRLHETEAEQRGVEFLNLGWAVEASEVEVSISSKTSNGILRTVYNSENGSVEHSWE